MKSKRILGILIALAGVVMILFSNYITGQVEEGKGRISSAESTVEQGNKLFSVTPESKAVGKAITGSAEKRIAEGKEQVSAYEELAKWLKIGGIGAIILGAIVVFFGGKRRTSH